MIWHTCVNTRGGNDLKVKVVTVQEDVGIVATFAFIWFHLNRNLSGRTGQVELCSSILLLGLVSSFKHIQESNFLQSYTLADLPEVEFEKRV